MRKNIIVAVIVSLILGCSSEGGAELGDGYLYVKTNKYNHYIVKGHEFVVDTNVVEYQISGNYVIGRRVKPEWFEVDKNKISKAYGYFILNKKTGNLEEGLSKEQ